MPYTPAPGHGGGTGGTGDGADTVARARANQAYSLATQASTAIQSHQSAAQPHKAYDEDIPNLTLIYKNGLI